MKTKFQSYPLSTSIRRRAIPLGCLFLCAATLVSPAELIFYDSRAEFEAALSEPRFVEGFDSFSRDRFLDTHETSVLGGAVVLSSESSTNWPIVVNTPEGEYLHPSNSNGVNFSGNFIVGESNNQSTGELRLDLSQSTAHIHSVGFDYEGAAGALSAKAHHYVGVRVMSGDGTATVVRLVDPDGNDDPKDDDLAPDDGFFGVIDTENPILWIELSPKELIDLPNPTFGEVYGIDNVTLSLPDGDLDGMPDFFETAHGLDKRIDDAAADADTDGVSNFDEFRRRLDPTVADTDGDGVDDGAESSMGSDPTDRNSPELYDLMVDLGQTETGPYLMPSPFRSYSDAGFAGASYAAFGTEISVTPEWPDSEAATSRGFVEYPGVSENENFGWDGRFFGKPLLRDMLVVDTQTGNGGNGDYDGVSGTPTRLSVVLGNLPAGSYQWSSMHHDIGFLHTDFIAEVSTDGGGSYQEIGRFQMTHSREGGVPSSDDTRFGPSPEVLPSTVKVSFETDGASDVEMRFTPLSAQGTAKRVLGINGFRLVQTGVGVDIPDSRLQFEIRRQLKKPTGVITRADLAGLTSLSIIQNSPNDELRTDLIDSLEGLQFATNLRKLELSGSGSRWEGETSPLLSQHIDFSPLSALRRLSSLNLSCNQLESLALPHFPNLGRIFIEGNEIAAPKISSVLLIDSSPERKRMQISWVGTNPNARYALRLSTDLHDWSNPLHHPMFSFEPREGGSEVDYWGADGTVYTPGVSSGQFVIEVPGGFNSAFVTLQEVSWDPAMPPY